MNIRTLFFTGLTIVSAAGNAYGGSLFDTFSDHQQVAEHALRNFSGEMSIGGTLAEESVATSLKELSNNAEDMTPLLKISCGQVYNFVKDNKNGFVVAGGLALVPLIIWLYNRMVKLEKITKQPAQQHTRERTTVTIQ